MAAGSRIREKRLELGLSQTDLGIRAQMSTATVSRIELDNLSNITIKTIIKLADALGCGMDWLTGRTDVDYYAERLKENEETAGQA